MNKQSKPVFSFPLPEYNTIGEEEIEGALEVLRSGVLSGFVAYPGPNYLGGKHVLELESSFCSRFNTKYAVSFNSATSALHASLIAAGVDQGDEVIVPPYTMSATSTAVLMCSATPIFVDVESDTFCLNVKLIEEAITKKTKAIIAVNLFGLPANLNPIRLIATKHNLVLIEDNSQAPAALYHGKFTGTIGHMGVFSLNRHKTMQCGEGGVVICNEDFYTHKLTMVRNHGEVVLAERPMNEYQDGDDKVIGYNYRLTELQAAIAIPQLRRLDELNDARIKLAKYLSESLQQFEFIDQPLIRKGCSHVFYLYPMLFDSKTAGMTRDEFVEQMQKEGAPISNYIRPLYRLPVYSARHDRPEVYSSKNFPVTENLWKDKMLVTSICRPPLGLEHIDIFIEAIRKVVGEVI